MFISRDATTKYTKRTQEGYERIASYIHEIVKNRQGNYMVFFPSYAFMKKVHEIYENLFMNTTLEECIVQSESMNEEEREEFLKYFSNILLKCFTKYFLEAFLQIHFANLTLHTLK